MAESLVQYPRRGFRASLRHATFIDPQSGARLKKTISLHSFDGADSEQSDGELPETSPLLLSQQSQRAAGSETVFSRFSGRVWDNTVALCEFLISDTGKGVLKCALAYLLGSMATFVPILSNLLGRNDSKHLVATITVYFHPARSLGSMLDALLLASAAFTYTALVSVLSMTIAAFFDDTVHLIAIGHAIVLVVFVGGGLGLVGWVKLKKGDPLVNIACSLTSLALITILTKEEAIHAGDFSFEKIAQILKMTIAGVIATMLVSFLVFPISARRKLKQNMVDVTDSLADMLALITSSFLSGDEAELEDQVLSKVTERHKKASATIAVNLKESKYEHYLLGTESHTRIESRLALCIQRITQSVGGLRSAAAMQFVIVKQPARAAGPGTLRSLASYGSVTTTSWTTAPDQSFHSIDWGLGKGRLSNPSNQSRRRPTSDSPHQPFRTASQIFDLFIDHLGPSMRSLAFTLKEILDDLPFDPDSAYSITVNPKFRISLERALDLYKNARQQALAVVYDKNDMDLQRPIEVEADWEEAAACCGHFSFSLLEVATEVNNYLVILDEMQLELEEHSTGRTWSWLKFWRPEPLPTITTDMNAEYAALAAKADDLDLHLRVPNIRRPPLGAEDTYKTKKEQIKRRFFRKVYDASSFLRKDDIKFAIKVGFGAIVYALPSFIPSTRPFYAHWRGEWGLLSYMLVCSMTIGASNTTGYSRVLGTCLGAGLAIIAWEVADANPVVLGFFGFCMAYWTAYIIIGKQKGPMGRFIMLTYNLSALYAYSLSVQDDENDGDEEDNARKPLIMIIVGHRVAAVISGCIWGLIITRAVWPISARQKLKDGLSLTWLRMGLIWKRDPLSILTEGEHPNRYMNLREELELQQYLSRLQALADAATNEFEFRGAFPHERYSQILKSTGQMLDAFHAMNMVILKDLQATPGEEALLRATTNERSQLCSRISHLFGVLASSMKLEYPIANDALPNIEHTRDRLLARIFAYRKTNAERQQTSDEDFSLLYTYALVTGQLAMEIQKVLKEVENLFGVLDEEALRLQ